MSVADACVASGKGTDYQVGPGTGQLASLNLVPWEKLTAGDTVRIFYSTNPYRGHILLAAKGTAAAPVRVCGVKGPNGERPIIDGQNAVARKGLSYVGASAGNIQEKRAIVMVDRLGTQDWGTAYPTYIQIDGLEIRAAHPSYTFTNSAGVVQAYDSFGGCIWVERGKNITIADNVIHDCTNGIYSRSVEVGAGTSTITENLRIAGNYIYGNGIVGDDHEHNLYIQSVHPVYEYNRIGAQRAGANGGAIKDRSVGSIVRYNDISEGSRSLDFVEAEDFPTTAMSYADYRTTYVYGNIITKNGSTGSAIHYGGDHYYSTPGSTWGEPIFRKGTLYFYNNTVTITGTLTAPVIFQLSTTEEKAEIWNNVFNFASTVTSPALRAAWDDVNTAYWTAGGTFNLGKNWVPSALTDAAGRVVPSTLTGFANLIKGTTSPTDSATLTPLSGSAIVDTAQALPAAVTNYPVQYQFDMSTLKGKTRTTFGTASDVGAVERPSK
ncbi:hypothetical protein JY96_03350 [Aquabacterium sp. NJ1]|uniref:right-handed parallel beta-helix repeat-containing protein n=1 Tax=Aquabacterium sp. NJ1 TaxID=1538295 RepID=UPI00052C4236|nr:right-handed parallel beta-helix repeat-containing protein [Aquabacterium sp. NJ1]KGM39382.1 hypothetical protein JY96_03350 [Aquabacterium sp. NJ1]